MRFNLLPSILASTILSFLLSFSLAAEDLSKRPFLMAPLTVEGSELSNIWIYPPLGNQEALVDKTMLLKAIAPLLKNHQAFTQFEQSHSERFIPISAFQALDLILFFDQEDLLLRASIRPHAKNATKVDLLSMPRKSTLQLTPAAKVSGYSNFHFGQRFTHSSYTDSLSEQQSEYRRERFNSSADFGLTFYKWLLQSQLQYQEGNEKPFVLGSTQVLYDLPHYSSRLHLGEFEVYTSGQQVPYEVGGVMLHRVFSATPSLVSRSNDSRKLMLKDESIVEVIINGAVVHKERYASGPVELSNFPFVGGMNQVLLRITDKFGKSETIDFTHLYDSDMLRAGTFEYSIAQGGLRETDQFGRAKYRDYSGVHSSFLRYGVNDQLTTGINFQKKDDDGQLGHELSWLSSVGVWENFLSLSREGTDTGNSYGHAYRLRYHSYDYIAGKLPAFNLRVAGEWFGRSYLYGNQQKSVSSVFISKRLSAFSPLSLIQYPALGLGLDFRDSYVKSNSYEIRGDFSFVVNRDWTVSINANRNYDLDSGKNFSASLDLSWSPANEKHSVWVSAESVDRDLSMRYRKTEDYESISTKYDAKVGHSLSGSYGELEGGLSGQRGEVQAQLTYAENSAYSQQSLNLEGRFALAFANNRWALGRYVGDSFVIIDTQEPPPADLGIRQGNGKSKAKIDFFGAALIADTSPYLYQEFSFDLSSLPDRYRLINEQFAVIPEYGSGTLLLSPIEERISVIANIVDQRGQRISYLSGQIEDSNGQTAGQFFSNREGRIYIERLPAGQYFLKLDDDLYAPLEIKVHINQQGMIDFGVMTFFDKETGSR